MIPFKSAFSYSLAAIAVLLVGVIVTQAFKQSRLELYIAQCERKNSSLRADKALSTITIESLKDAVSKQGIAVELLKRKAGERQVMVREAQIKAAKQRAEAVQSIADLSAMRGESCAEGISLIDMELEL